MNQSSELPENSIPASRVPSTATFILLLITLWALNLTDVFQTLFLKESGFLAAEANLFVDFFLKGGRAPFFLSKVLALILITSILARGWFDRRGIKLNNYHYDRDKVRGSIHFLLAAGVIYYILIVAFPFVVLVLSGLFSTAGEATL